tara:strand:- start:558 stop:1523 length:966 start_codon:yes stop_codon:yes gene_type:complete
MAIPNSREKFKDYILRKIGAPVIEINVAEEQVEDRIDEAISFWADYHYNGSQQVYLKHQITGSSLTLDSAVAANFSVGETITGGTSGATAKVSKDSTGTTLKYDNLTHKELIPFQANETITGFNSGVSATATAVTKGDRENGYIQLPDGLLGISGVFPLTTNLSTGSGIFNVQYQFVLNNIEDITGYNVQNYYMAMSHLQFLQEILVGKPMIRYNKHVNRLHIDVEREFLTVGEYIIIEAYDVIDGNTYTDVWGDRWLQNYATVLVREQWGLNLTKFTNMQLVGGVSFNGEQILSEARAEREKMEEEAIRSYQPLTYNFIG